MNNPQPQVFVLGAVNIDYKMCPPKIPGPDELFVSKSFTIDAGGKANGQACALAKLGVTTYLISCIGKLKPDCDDGTGDLVDVRKLSKWQEIKLNTEFVVEYDGQTGVTLITNNDEGKHSICEYMGVNSRVQRRQIDDAFEKAKRGDFFLTTYEPGEDTTNYALLRAKDKGMKTILSPAPTPDPLNIDNLKVIDYMVVYKNELEKITKIKFESKTPSLQEISKCYKFFDNPNLTLIVCLGPKDGAIYKTSTLLAYIESPEVNVVDSTLCRGAFIGGFVYQLTKKQDLENSLRFANCASAYCATKVGAINALPYLQNVENYMKQNQ